MKDVNSNFDYEFSKSNNLSMSKINTFKESLSINNWELVEQHEGILSS